MKFLKCIICRGEVDLMDNDRSFNKKIRCLQCGFTNHTEIKTPEVFIMRRRPIISD